jgi:hypothetical protein
VKIDYLVSQVLNYCVENSIKWHMDINDTSVTFTFKSDLIAHRVYANVKSKDIVRNAHQLIVTCRNDHTEIDLKYKQQKIRHVMIACIVMILLYFLLFLKMF